MSHDLETCNRRAKGRGECSWVFRVLWVRSSCPKKQLAFGWTCQEMITLAICGDVCIFHLSPLRPCTLSVFWQGWKQFPLLRCKPQCSRVRAETHQKGVGVAYSGVPLLLHSTDVNDGELLGVTMAANYFDDLCLRFCHLPPFKLRP